jgi:hypothetical protein
MKILVAFLKYYDSLSIVYKRIVNIIFWTPFALLIVYYPIMILQILQVTSTKFNTFIDKASNIFPITIGVLFFLVFIRLLLHLLKRKLTSIHLKIKNPVKGRKYSFILKEDIEELELDIFYKKETRDLKKYSENIRIALNGPNKKVFKLKMTMRKRENMNSIMNTYKMKLKRGSYTLVLDRFRETGLLIDEIKLFGYDFGK